MSSFVNYVKAFGKYIICSHEEVVKECLVGEKWQALKGINISVDSSKRIYGIRRRCTRCNSTDLPAGK